MRTSKINRITRETNINFNLNIDGSGEAEIQTPINFFSHMIDAFCRHGIFNIELKAEGDIEVDQHHTIEDIGIVMGKAFKEALQDKYGIARAGCFTYMMDDALIEVVVDLGGRPYLLYDVELRRRFCGDFDTDLLEHFFEAFSVSANMNISIRKIRGKMDHHIIEAMFKAFAKAMLMACTKIDRARIPSTKGVIA